MKILTGNEAIEAYVEMQASESLNNMPKKKGYFNVDDCDFETGYDRGTILAFDSTSGNQYEDIFGNRNEAIEWLEL